jgi:hypothetical protein
MKELIHFKPISICTVLLKSIILNDYCKKNNLKFTTFIKSEHAGVLDIINPNLNIELTDYNYTFEKRGCELDLKTKYYFKNMHAKNLSIDDIDIFDEKNSSLDNLKVNNLTLVDIVLDRHSHKLSSINHKISCNKNFVSLDNNTCCFNLFNPFNDKLGYELYEYILNFLSPKKVFFVSGNKDMLKYFNEKYNLPTLDKNYDISIGAVKGEIGRKLTRGKADDMIYDALKCSTANFYDLQRIKSTITLPSKFKELFYIRNYNHKDSFDVFVKFLKNNLC